MASAVIRFQASPLQMVTSKAQHGERCITAIEIIHTEKACIEEKDQAFKWKRSLGSTLKASWMKPLQLFHSVLMQ